MPANILTHWQAYFELRGKESVSPPAETITPAAASSKDDQFADCLRILGNG